MRRLLKQIPFGEIRAAVDETEAIPVLLGLILGNISNEFVTDAQDRGLLNSVWKSYVIPTMVGTQNFDQTAWNGQVDGWIDSAVPATGSGYLRSGPYMICLGLGYAFAGSNPLHPYYLKLKAVNKKLKTAQVATLAEVEQAGAFVVAPGFDPSISQFVYIRETPEYSDASIRVWLAFVRTDGFRYALGGLENWLLAMLGADMGRELNTIPPHLMNALANQMVADGSVLANETLTNEAYCLMYQAIRTLGEGEIEFMNQVKYVLGRAVIWIMRDANPVMVNGVQVPRPLWTRVVERLPEIAGWLAVIVSAFTVIFGGIGGLLYGGLFLFGCLSTILWFMNFDPTWVASIMLVFVVLEWISLIPTIYLDRILEVLEIDEENRVATPGIRSHALKIGIAFTVFVSLLVIGLVAMPSSPNLVKMSLACGVMAVIGIGVYFEHYAIVKRLTIAVITIAGVFLVGLMGWNLLHFSAFSANKQTVVVRSVTYSFTENSEGVDKYSVVVTELDGAPFNAVPATSRVTHQQSSYVMQFSDNSFRKYTGSPKDYHWYNFQKTKCSQGAFVRECFVAQETLLHGWFEWLAMPGESYMSLSDKHLAEECGLKIPIENFVPSWYWFAIVGLSLITLGVLFKIVSVFLPDNDEKAEKRQKSLSETGGSLIKWGLVSLLLLTPIIYGLGFGESILRGNQPIEKVIRR